MAIKRFIRSTALLGASGAVIALVPLAQAAPAGAASSQYAFSANAYGTQVSASLVGLGVTSGRSANVTLGCTTRSQTQQNSTVAANLAPISSTVGAVSTKLTTNRNPGTGVYSDTADSTIGAVSLLGGAITADAIKADATASEGGTGGAAASASVTLTNLKVGGTTITNPKANDTIAVSNLGTVVINSQKIIKTSGRALANVDAIVVTLSADNTLGLPTGATITIGHAMATVGGPVSGLLSGSSFGSSLTGGPVTSGPTFQAYVNCTGTGGVTVTKTGTLGTISGSPVSAGLVTDTAKGVDNATALSADTSSDVANLRVANTGLLPDLVSVDVIHVTAHADVTGGTLNDSGATTIGTLKLLGVTITLPQTIPANYNVDLTGLTGLTGATLTLNKHIVGKSGLQVEGLVLTLPAVGTLVIASASAYA